MCMYDQIIFGAIVGTCLGIIGIRILKQYKNSRNKPDTEPHPIQQENPLE